MAARAGSRQANIPTASSTPAMVAKVAGSVGDTFTSRVFNTRATAKAVASALTFPGGLCKGNEDSPRKVPRLV